MHFPLNFPYGKNVFTSIISFCVARIKYKEDKLIWLTTLEAESTLVTSSVQL
jgi:hypothetical protein